MQCVLAVRETVVIKLSRLNIMAQGLSNSLPVPSLSPYDTPLSQKGEVAQHLHLTHTMVWRYTTLVPPPRQDRIDHSIGPPVVRGPRGHLLDFTYHITFYKYGSTRV